MKATPASRFVQFPEAYFDAFNRQRVSNQASLFDTSFQYNIPSMTWQTKTATGGTVAHSGSDTSATPQVLMSVTGTTGSLAILQTRQYFRYQAGKSQLVKITAIPGAPVANVRKRVGYFDAQNGVFWEQNGTTDVALVVRSNSTGAIVDTRYTQANWSCDKMDGKGKSGVLLDPSKGMIFAMDLQWLGLGTVSYYFEVDRQLNPAHYAHHANKLSVPYMRHANLPLRYEIESIGASAGASFVPVCASLDSEDGYDWPNGYDFCAENDADITVGTVAERNMIALRLKDTFNGSVNRGQIMMIEISAIAGTKPVYFHVYMNRVISAGTPAWASVNAESITEFSVADLTFTGGQHVGGFFVPTAGGASRQSGASRISTKLPISLDIDGTPGSSSIITIMARSIGGNSASRACVSWKEMR